MIEIPVGFLIFVAIVAGAAGFCFGLLHGSYHPAEDGRKFVRAMDAKYDEGYNLGYDRGKEDGMRQGRTEGKEIGCEYMFDQFEQFVKDMRA